VQSYGSIIQTYGGRGKREVREERPKEKIGSRERKGVVSRGRRRESVAA
jgi:hypothetical protein